MYRNGVNSAKVFPWIIWESVLVQCPVSAEQHTHPAQHGHPLQAVTPPSWGCLLLFGPCLAGDVALSACLLGPLQAGAVPHPSFGFNTLTLWQIGVFLTFWETTRLVCRAPLCTLSAGGDAPVLHGLTSTSIWFCSVWRGCKWYCVWSHSASPSWLMTTVSLCMLINQLCILFGDMFSRIFCPFKNPHLSFDLFFKIFWGWEVIRFIHLLF